GCAAAARASYREFAVLKRDGVVPAGCRFQVCLPTPLAPISAFVALPDQARVEPPYEARMMAELDEILAGIPADQLGIQWDTNFEFGMLEGAFPTWFEDVKAGILERLLRISRRVPAEVELGFHLCYGDTLQGFHREPRDLGRPEEIATALSAGLGRARRHREGGAGGPSAGRRASPESPTRSGCGRTSTPPAASTTAWTTTAGIGTSTPPSSSWRAHSRRATCWSTTRAAPGSCSTGCGCASSTARSG